jgi:hypothetical protein
MPAPNLSQHHNQSAVANKATLKSHILRWKHLVSSEHQEQSSKIGNAYQKRQVRSEYLHTACAAELLIHLHRISSVSTTD